MEDFIQVDDVKVQRIIRKIVIEENKNIKSRKLPDAKMIDEIKEIIKKEVDKNDH